MHETDGVKLEKDSFLQKTKKLYENTRTQRNVTKLQQELKDVQHIMTKNIHQVLERGEKLESRRILLFLFSETKHFHRYFISFFQTRI